jgi:hypothetical protein
LSQAVEFELEEARADGSPPDDYIGVLLIADEEDIDDMGGRIGMKHRRPPKNAKEWN